MSCSFLPKRASSHASDKWPEGPKSGPQSQGFRFRESRYASAPAKVRRHAEVCYWQINGTCDPILTPIRSGRILVCVCVYYMCFGNSGYETFFR